MKSFHQVMEFLQSQNAQISSKINFKKGVFETYVGCFTMGGDTMGIISLTGGLQDWSFEVIMIYKEILAA